MRYIELPSGERTKVDGEVYDRVVRFNWCRNGKDGHVHRVVARQKVWLHHVVAGRPPRGMVTDHINGDVLDNRRANLRNVTWSQNAINRAKFKTRNRHKGVTWYASRSKWRARIQARGKEMLLGYFATEREAVAAYRTASKQHHGAYARTLDRA